MKMTVLLRPVLVSTLLTFTYCGGGGAGGGRVYNPDMPLKVTTLQLPEGQAGKAYSGQLAAAGGAGPYCWSVVLGKLPQGVSLNAANGTLSGTPLQAGTFSFTAEVSDSSLFQQQTALQSLTISVSPPPLTITTTTLPMGALG
jgi:hypothetical protein